MEEDCMLSHDINDKAEGILQIWVAIILEPFVCVKIRDKRELYAIIISNNSLTHSYVLEQP